MTRWYFIANLYSVTNVAFKCAAYSTPFALSLI